MEADRSIAYFSMEVGLEPSIPTYSGGLGILAGDTVKAAADLNVPMVAVTLLHRQGYFYQHLDASGWQTETPVEWVVGDFVSPTEARITVNVEGRAVHVRAWRYDVTGVRGHTVPVYLLDTEVEENSEWDRTLTHTLYGGDAHYRLCQEIILGIGGVRVLRALGYREIARYHMNEGHAAFLSLELLAEQLTSKQRDVIVEEDVRAVREQCVFTTHTPVPAGHDQFPMDMVQRVLGDHAIKELHELCCFEGKLNMTFLALNLSHYVNGVAKRHGDVSRHMFAGYAVDSITNGVHAATWTSESFQELFDRHIPGWREDPFSLRYAISIPSEEIWSAHTENKHALIDSINRETNGGLDRDDLTLGFARRATPYKRADLLFFDPQALERIVSRVGPLQVVYAGKAHPHDENGKQLIQRIFEYSRVLHDLVKVVYLPNYDMTLGRLLTAGVDVWLNTPQPPMEASGTSGMKAALNGVPSLSILDGWWIEGCIEGKTGWSIGEFVSSTELRDNRPADAASLYDKLGNVVLPMFLNQREAFIDVMRQAIALNGSFFNTHRMIQQYVVKAYLARPQR